MELFWYSVYEITYEGLEYIYRSEGCALKFYNLDMILSPSERKLHSSLLAIK